MTNNEQLEYPDNILNSPPDRFMAAFINALTQQLGVINLTIGYIDDELDKPNEELDRQHIKDACKNLYSTVELAKTIANIGLEYDKHSRDEK